MPVLKELDLNATCEDYCFTITSLLSENHLSVRPANGVQRIPGTVNLQPIPQEVKDNFE